MELPKHLYKYQSFNTISLANLSNRQLYFCNPIEFNDPYDCALDITFKDLTEEEYKKFIDHYYSNLAEELSDEILNIIWETKGNIDGHKKSVDRGLDKLLKDLKEKYLTDRGIVSLSAKNDDIIMWGHYSDGHKGFCLEFDTNFEPFDTAKEVNYSDVIPELEAHRILEPDDQDSHHLIKPLTTKFTDWSYEKEFRLIHKEHSKVYHFEAEALTGIYFGLKMDKVSEDIISMILKERYPHVKMYRAKKRNDRFDLKFEELFFKN